MTAATDALDQFYTKPQTAQDCVGFLDSLLPSIGSGDVTCDDLQYLEPSAGAGSFLDYLPDDTIAFDLAPQSPKVAQLDFFHFAGPTGTPRSHIIVIGNPPFGRRGKTALRFCQHASGFADTIAFIMPMCFTKYGTQKHFPAGYQLIGQQHLGQSAFFTPQGTTPPISAVFQVWTALECELEDLRIRSAPPIHHHDFTLHQYNNTRQAEKLFDLPFDFAVPCQGYQDYARRETDPADCERHKQWMLFDCQGNESTRRTLWQLDFEQLAHQQATVTPGFRKHDVIRAYAAELATGASSPLRPTASQLTVN